jgi:hypothetical protein
MPKYVKTIVKKSSIIPWLADGVVSADSVHLTEAERQSIIDARIEGESFPGYIGFNVTNVGNTQMVSFEFDTIENLNNFVNKTQKPDSGAYDNNSLIVKYNKMLVAKIKELGLSNSYQVTTSIET